MNQSTLISVVIPVYNAAQYLNECIDSILVQTYQNFEIILVDDGSTDNSVEIIKSYTDERVCLICNTHNYIQSLNIGMTKAKGKYIARMDSDDIMMPNRLELQYNYMEDHPEIDVCGGAAQCFGNSTKLITLAEYHTEIICNLIILNPMIHPTTMMKRNIVLFFPKVKGIYQCYKTDYQYAEDYKLWTDLAIKDCVFANISDILLKYRTSENQVTNRNYDEMMKCTYKISAEYIEYTGNQMIKMEPAFENFLNDTIELHNAKKINYTTLQEAFYLINKTLYC